ncbi:methyl-accepting chemotaxis protein [Robertmurraya kyonggiensis]|uniref:Methyl-accepting chemotaxis protein n=1 Tax=Robertmurraya kyonggiensis TaxID=1037680 RepID=A0A4U1CX51_9BACI|nr:HAMP domain-containing methyl-accepting chemotaxis protein [Robertmurraya kyonggiensis]TKC14405.1 methyl-accepting chemotaxis protein [Robertmurraya kyonggiensis]
MKKLKQLSFTLKTILLTSILMLLIGVILLVSSIEIQKSVLENEMEKQAMTIANQWGEKIKFDLVEKSAANPNTNGPDQKKLIEFFDSISENNPMVAQGYVLGTDLQEGNQSVIISTPRHMIDALAEFDIHIGDLYEQPPLIVDEIQKLIETKKPTSTEVYEDDFGTWITVLYPITNKSGEVYAYFGVDVDASMVTEGTSRFLMNSLLILIPLLIVFVLVQIFVIRKNAQPLKHLSAGITEMSNGNLDIQLPTREDDLGKMNQAFNDMALDLKRMISKISETSTTVLQSSGLVKQVTDQSMDASTQVSDNIKQMTNETQVLETSVMESSAAIEQMAIGIGEIASFSQDIAQVSKDMESFAYDGLSSIRNVVTQMDTINETVEKSSQVVSSLQERSDEISSILDVITGISAQTNLLALNAAIEAARAGEHGKGFAVVAQEVRKLAEESSKSTERISKIIEEIQVETSKAVSAMVVGTKETQKGTEYAHATGQLFEKIKAYTDQISSKIESISASSQEISAGAEEVSATSKELTAIASNNSEFTLEIEASTQEQMESISQLSDAAQELNKLANELQSMVTRFKA